MNVSEIRELLNKKEFLEVKKRVELYLFPDIAEIIDALNDHNSLIFWRIIGGGYEFKSQVITHISFEKADMIFRNISVKETASIILDLGSDELLKILDNVEDEAKSKIERCLPIASRIRLTKQLEYEPDTAGIAMNTFVRTFTKHDLVGDVKKTIQSSMNQEVTYYIYVLSKSGRLVGVVSMRALLFAEDDKFLKDIMKEKGLVKAKYMDSQKRVAKSVQKYNLVSLPVVDDFDHFLGIITVDDIIDIIHFARNKDISMLAGTSDKEFVRSLSPMNVALVRLPWVVWPMFGSLVTAFLYNYFGMTVESFLTLIIMAPVVMSLGGNIGGQSASVMLGNIYSGRVHLANISKTIFKELLVGAMIGLICGFCIFFVAAFFEQSFIYGLIVGISVLLNSIIAIAIGTIIPGAVSFLKLDPALVSLPLIQTLVDIAGISIYFITAIVVLIIL